VVADLGLVRPDTQPMKLFSFARFVALLARVLEIGIVAALVLRWVDALLGIWSRVALPSAPVEAALNFSFFAIVTLLAADLWLLLTRQPRAVPAALRVLLYIVIFMLSPYRLGGSAREAANRPNQSVELTATRRTFTFQMTKASSIRASLALGGGSSLLSR